MALDCARILSSASSLSATDVPCTSLEELLKSRIENIKVVGRRGPSNVGILTFDFVTFCVSVFGMLHIAAACCSVACRTFFSVQISFTIKELREQFKVANWSSIVQLDEKEVAELEDAIGKGDRRRKRLLQVCGRLRVSFVFSGN